jgi:uncharacterized membrane protein YbhN (UPF0104 family)
MLLVGIGLLIVVLHRVDLPALWDQVRALGWGGLAAVAALSCLWPVNDVTAWMLTFPSLRPTARWYRRLGGVHLFGEALNQVTPMASFGGEPVKALLLHVHYDVGYRQGSATLVIAHTIIVCAELLFLIVGVALMIRTPALPGTYPAVAAGLLAVLILSVAALILIQRYRLASRLGRWLNGPILGRQASRIVRNIRAVETHLLHFYVRRPKRVAAVFLLQFANWCIGATEIFLVLHFLGHPVSFGEAWVIEACVVLMRTAMFVVPANIGAQEGMFFLVGGAITGLAAPAVAVALIRRARELLWIGVGLGVGTMLSFHRRTPDGDPPLPHPNPALAGGSGR